MGFDKAKAIRAAEKYLAQGKISSALQEYQRIVGADASDFAALNTVGDLYARLDMKSEAVACYRRVAEHYREQGFTLKAIAMYKKLTRFGAEDHQTAVALARLYEQQGLMAEARAQYMLAADAYTRAGERLAARGDFDNALDAFTKALALRPVSHAALAGLLAAHTELGTADEAAEILEEAAGERPDDVEVRAMLVRAYVEAEDAWRAEAAAKEVVERDPSSFTLYFEVIRLHLRQGSLGDAARLLGWVCDPALAGRQDGPLVELLQEVLARDPEQMEAQRLLVRAYSALHDDDRLRSALERLVELAEAAGDRER